MADSVEISIEILRNAINGIFDFIDKDLGVRKLALKQNYYWSIADDVLYAME